METERPRVAAVVALKAGEQAKSRLASLPDPLRRELAWAMAVDTLTALAGAVPLVLVVSDITDLARRLADAGVEAQVAPERERGGMNAALRQGDHELRAAGVRKVIACVGDLPALTPAAVTEVSARTEADDHVDLEGRFVLPDRSGRGTTMLVARGVPLDPLFQGDSAARHLASRARSLLGDGDAALARARCDVDTEDDLSAALRLGLGRATNAALASDPTWGPRLR